MKKKHHCISKVLEYLFHNNISKNIIVLVILINSCLSINAINIKTTNKVKNQQVKSKNKIITGNIIDQNGKPVPFAAVCFKGTTSGCVAAEDGIYSIRLPKGETNATLEFSSLGYRTKSVEIKGRIKINIILEKNIVHLNEVVATGYQKLTRERASGAFGSVDKTVIKLKPVTSVNSLLFDQVAGVNGNSIRGIGSFHSGRPLIVLDGFPIGTMSDINPNNVESITVLKDAAAASIWGARSGNGVIVITTKKAEQKDHETMHVSFKSFIKTSDMIDLDQVNTQPSSEDQLAIEKYFTEEYIKANPHSILRPNELTFNNSIMMKTEGSYLYGMLGMGYFNDKEKAAAYKRLDELKHSSYKSEAYKYLIRRPMYYQNNLSIRGNSGKHTYNFSFLYENEHNIHDCIGAKDHDMKLNFRDYFKFNDNITFMASLYTSITKNHSNGIGVMDLGVLAPYDRLVNDDGSYANETSGINWGMREYLNKYDFPYNWNYNVLQDARNKDKYDENINDRVQFGLNIKIIKGLSLDSKLQYTLNKHNSKNFSSDQVYSIRRKINLATRFEKGVVSDRYYPEGGIISGSGLNNSRSYDIRNQLNFNRFFTKKHYVNIILGTDVIQNKSDGFTLPPLFGASKNRNGGSGLKDMKTSQNFGVIGNISSTGDRRTVSYSSGRTRYFSAYSNGSYTFDNRYTVTGSVRIDASNIVSDKAKYRYTPLWSTGFNWNIAKEKFMKNVDFVSRLNLRMSYGLNANAAGSTPNVTTVSYQSGDRANDYMEHTAFHTGNPDLHWETTRTVNLGADFDLLGGKIFGTIEAYNRKGRDLFYKRVYPSTVGVGSLQVNYASITNKGFEVTLGTNINIIKNLSVNSRVNYSYNHNKVTKLAPGPTTIYDQRGSGGYYLGTTVGDMWAFKYNGYDDKGVPNVISKDGRLYPMNTPVPSYSNDDMPLLYNVGHTIAPHVMSWNTTIRFHEFSVMATITGKFGYKFRNYDVPFSSYSVTGMSTYNRNLLKYINNPDNPDFPSSINASNMANLRQQRLYVNDLSSYVGDASYIRFNTLLFNYNFTKYIRKVKFISDANIYCNIDNVGILWKGNRWHIDPQYPVGSPNRHTYIIGLKINFK